jgi:hypothetical protein
MEQWKQIEDCPKFEVSTFGNVRHIKHKRNRKLRTTRQGYIQIVINMGQAKYRTFSVHRLVAMAFLDAKPYDVVDHRDRDKSNNTVNNLRVTTTHGNLANRNIPSTALISKIIDLHKTGLNVNEIAELI